LEKGVVDTAKYVKISWKVKVTNEKTLMHLNEIRNSIENNSAQEA